MHTAERNTSFPFQRYRKRPHWLGTHLFLIPLCALVLLPVFTILALSFSVSEKLWPHLLLHVLPSATCNTILLLAAVGICTTFLGTTTAWFVTMFRFPGRGLFLWLLPAPLAIPSYITAYCYAEMLDFNGALQNFLLTFFSREHLAAFWFPDLYSLGGAIYILSIGLYPYIFVTARCAFASQSSHLLGVSRTLGHTAGYSFFKIALPLARPALVAGCTLVAMETLNDIGTTEFLGVQTLTLAVYSSWLSKGSLIAAAQISMLLLALVFFLICMERIQRRNKGYSPTEGKAPPTIGETPGRWAGWIMCGFCALPILLGFLLPVLLLLQQVQLPLHPEEWQSFWTCVQNSLYIATGAAGIATLIALFLNFTRTRKPPWITQLACIGYAIPGTVLGIGILIPFTLFDNWLDHWTKQLLGISIGLFFSGSIFLVMLAHILRFLAIANGTISAKKETFNPHLPQAARTLGHTEGRAFLRIQLPLLRPAIVSAILLVFIDSIKELPATLLLQPFDFQTLPVHVYSYASLERFEEAALSALTIILIGVIGSLLIPLCNRSDPASPVGK